MEAAEKLKISAQNLNSVLTQSLEKISATRKRTKKLKAVSILRKRRKKKEVKLEVPSAFKKSVRKVKNKITGGSGDMFKNILGFVSLLVLGVALTNIEEIQQKIEDARKQLVKTFEPVINTAKAIFEGAQSFINLFNEKESDKELSEIEKNNKKLEENKKDFDKLKEGYEKLSLTYEDLASGEYAKSEGYRLADKGTLSDKSTFKYQKNNKKPYLVTNADGSTERYTFDEFFQKYSGTDMQNFILKDPLENRVVDSTDVTNLNKMSEKFNIQFDSNLKDISFLTEFDEDLFSDSTDYIYLQRYFTSKEGKP